MLTLLISELVDRLIAQNDEGTESSAAGTKTYAYAYDPAGRLTQVTLNANPYRAFAYDANGNRTQTTKQTPSGPVTQTATYDAQDRQTTSGDHALTYNDNGELTAKTNTQSGETLALQYKTSGDLAKATTPDGRQLTYKYDAFGNRTAELEDGALKAAYLYAPGISNPIAKVDQSGTEEARYIYATRSHVPDFMVQGSTTYRLITDQLGSIRQVVNASTGVVAQEITYDPFGEVVSDSNPGFQPFGFAGGLYEPKTGLTHFGAREYDAELGRWTSSDPIGFAGGDTNLYGYVIQDPVNLIDPSGLYGVGDLWNDAKGTVSELDDTFKRGAFGEYLSNYAAGALNTMSFGLSNRIAGVSGKCAGPGYGFGSFAGSLVPVGGGFKRTEAALDRIMKARATDVFSQKLFASLSAINLYKASLGSSYKNLIKPFARDSGSVAGRLIGTEFVRRSLESDDACGC